MPTLRPISGTGGYLLAYEKKPADANVIRIAYYRSRGDLLAGRAARQRNLPRSLSPYANGTPTILWVNWGGGPARSLIGIGFHYQSQANRAPAADREAIGLLAGFSRWTVRTDDDADETRYGQGLRGNPGG